LVFVGRPDIRKDLESLSSNPVNTAFVGLPGTGKRTTAKTTALLHFCGCREGSCRTCGRVERESFPDISYFGADEGTLSVDTIRSVVRESALAPVERERKFFVVENASKMSWEAQNAFLKALEEPAGGTVFLLCVDDLADLQDTVRSRLHTIRLRPFLPNEVMEILGAGDDLARVSGGSLRVARYLMENPDTMKTRREWLGILSNIGNIPVHRVVGWVDKQPWDSEEFLGIMSSVTGDVLRVMSGGGVVVHADLKEEIGKVASSASGEWVSEVVRSLSRATRFSAGMQIKAGLMTGYLR